MRYWLAIGGESVGPFAVEEVADMLQQRRITRDTPTMPEEGDEWSPLSGQPELAELPAPPPAPPMRSMQPRPALGGARPGVPPQAAGNAPRPVTVAQPSSVVPVVIILVVIAVLAGGGGIVVYQHSQSLKREAAAAEAKAAAQKQAAEAAAKAAAEKAANPALALEGASRDVVLAALKNRGAVIRTQPLEVNLSATPTTDTDLAMLKSLRELKVLHLGAGKITNEGMRVLAGFSELRELSIGAVVPPNDDSQTKQPSPHAADLQISEAAIEHLEKLKGLHKLFLWNCDFTDAVFEELDAMHALYDLELINTSVSESAARKFIAEHPQIAVTVKSSHFVIEP